jgi:hypothetical protein
MASKQFKIGEYAVGGIIKVDVSVESVTIQALDYNTKSVVQTQTFTLNRSFLGAVDSGKYWAMKDFLNDLTSSYYADKVMEYIETTAHIEHQIFRN